MLRLDRISLTHIANGAELHTIVNGAHILNIYMNSNGLVNVPGKFFSKLYDVKILWLSGNKLSRLEKGTFNDLSHLEGLWLNHNELTSLDKEMFYKNVELR